MEKILLLLSALLFISCTTNSPSKKDVKEEVDEVVDIRIHSNGDIRFNGLMISDSSLASHIENLKTVEITRARVILDENAPTGLVHKAQHLLYKQKVAKIKFKALTSEKFKYYQQNNFHIDVLSSGELLFEGKQLYPKDLKISLKNIETSPSTRIIVSVSENAQVGPVFDTLEELADKNMTRITFEDLSKYYRL